VMRSRPRTRRRPRLDRLILPALKTLITVRKDHKGHKDRKISCRDAKPQRFKTKVELKQERGGNGNRYLLLFLRFPAFGCALSSWPL
jgi:hypothetical protein